MKKILLITFSSLKKKKANAVVLLFLVALAVMLLHISLSALTYSNTLTKNKIAKANSPDVVVVGTNLENNLDSNLINIDGYVSHESEKAIVATDAIILKGEEKETMMSIFYNYDSPRNMQIPYLIDAGNEIKANSIVVPYYLHLAEGYNIGDNITLSSSSGNFEYVIYGYFEDLYFANPTIITMYKFYLMNGGFTDLTEASEIPGSTLTNVDTYKIDISTNAGKFENELSQFFTSHMYIFLSVDVDLISVAGTAIVSILLAIILLFAVIIIVVSFVVIRFTINSHIGNNIKNLGALSSIGYTSRQLRLSTCLEFLFISTAGGLLGLFFSLAFSGVVNNALSNVCGLEWVLPFDLFFAILTYLGIIIFVFIISYFSSKKCKQITPLAALRNGIETHNYKRNSLPLAKTKLGLNTNLGLKSLLKNHMQNIGIIVIISLLTFACITMLVCGSNFSSAKGPIMDVIGIEFSNVKAQKATSIDVDVEEIYKEITNDSDVRMVNYETAYSLNLISQTDKMTVAVRAFRDNSILEIKSLYQGKEALRDDEIVVSTIIAELLSIEIGDLIYIESDTAKEEFYVVGIIQHMNNMGKSARMTEEGIKRLDAGYHSDWANCNIYLKEGIETNEFIEKLNSKYSNMGIDFINMDELAKTTLRSIHETFKVITSLLIAITIIIVTLITILIIKMRLIKEKRMLGIYKALGFTTKNLMYQMIISFTPIILVGSSIGAICSLLLSNKVFALCLNSYGIKKVSLVISPYYIIFGIIIIFLITLLITLVYSFRIRKIEPYRMIIEL